MLIYFCQNKKKNKKDGCTGTLIPCKRICIFKKSMGSTSMLYIPSMNKGFDPLNAWPINL